MADVIEHLQQYSNTIKEIIESAIEREGRYELTEETTIEPKELVEYDRRMRVSALDKFNGSGYLSAINFYRSIDDQEKGKTCGAIVVNVLEEDIKRTLAGVGIMGVDEEDDENIIEKVNELCAMISDQFRNRVGSGLVTSDPMGNRNTIPDGVDFSYDQYDKYDIGFTSKEKLIVVEITMTPIN